MRTLLGTGSTPWEALVDLAETLKAARSDDDSIVRATEDVQMRMMRVARIRHAERWIVEARWVVG